MVIGTIISQSKQVIFGMNGVKIKRHGLILWENDATGLKIVLEWFPGPNNLLKKSNIAKKTENSKNPDFLYNSLFPLLALFGVTAGVIN